MFLIIKLHFLYIYAIINIRLCIIGEKMKCNKCNAEIERDDNFCWECGHWTTIGYSYFKQNPNQIKNFANGSVIKQHSKLGLMVILLGLVIILFSIMVVIQGRDMFRPYVYLKKQIMSLLYGYNISLISTNNQYNGIIINSIDDAYRIIEKDFSEQQWQCRNDLQVYLLEKEISQKYKIPSINFCDISFEEANKIRYVIDNIYTLFPNIEGYLTNITITNTKELSEYVAYFQPIYQFVNIDDDINKVNKVNKTQILLNSYYFLNDRILNTSITDSISSNWYVNDASWESTIAHEFGHYITFVLLLKEYNIDNITLVTRDNYKQFNDIIKISNDGSFSTSIVDRALYNYNNKYNLNYDIETFAKSISEYASSRDREGYLLVDETIAEAVHDYYLHKNNASLASMEIINILNQKLQEL